MVGNKEFNQGIEKRILQRLCQGSHLLRRPAKTREGYALGNFIGGFARYHGRIAAPGMSNRITDETLALRVLVQPGKESGLIENHLPETIRVRPLALHASRIVKRVNPITLMNEFGHQFEISVPS